MKQNTFFRKMDNIRKTASKAVVNATANVLSAPAQIKSGLARRQSDKEYGILKEENDSKGAPSRDANGNITRAGMARSLAYDIKAKAAKKGFVPTPALGKVGGALRARLQKEAPETLVAPLPNAFASKAAYDEAVKKYKKYGNWASDK